jgi:hypothetical protein
MQKQKAIEKLTQQLQIIDALEPKSFNDLESKPLFSNDFKKWKRDTEVTIEFIFSKDTRHIQDFYNIQYEPSNATSNIQYYLSFKKGLDDARALLQSMIQEVKDFWEELGVNQSSISNSFKTENLAIIERICNRFHLFATQLQIRHKIRNGNGKRPTLEITDEYDVQDLFHSLLKLYFDNITPEEPIPNFAGRPSRVDLFLPEEETFIEIKKTRQGLGDKELREQLIVDIAQYKQHKGWKTLICFVYDYQEGTEPRIKKPRAIEKDLSGLREGLDVKVFIRPKVE